MLGLESLSKRPSPGVEEKTMKKPLAFALIWIGTAAVALADDLVKPMIIGGTEASDDQFAEVASFETSIGLCSAVLIGPRVLLTAAHCASQNLSAAEIRFAHQVLLGTVEIHPDHHRTPQSDRDIALVLLDSPVENISAASIRPDTNIVVDQNVTLVGYGCSENGGSGAAGVKRFGKSLISEVQAGLYVVRQSLGSAVCFGDSGGPLYANSTDENEASLSLIGVHAAGNLRDTTYSVRLNAAENLQFMLVFADKHRVDICGLTIDCAPIQAHQ
jgi:hypothetical protein